MGGGGVLPLFMGAEVGPGLWAAWAQGAAAVFTGRRGGFMGAGLRPEPAVGPRLGLVSTSSPYGRLAAGWPGAEGPSVSGIWVGAPTHLVVGPPPMGLSL